MSPRYAQRRRDPAQVARDDAVEPDAPLARLHRAAGNRAVAGLAAGPALPVQRVGYPNLGAMWAGVLVGGAGLPPYGEADVLSHVAHEPALRTLYAEAAAALPHVDFQVVAGLPRPEADLNPAPPPAYAVRYDPAIPADRDFFAACVLHELGHVAVARAYAKPGAAAADPELTFANVHVPPSTLPGAVAPGALPADQVAAVGRQILVLNRNWQDLRAEFDAERASWPPDVAAHVAGRIGYGGSTTLVHNETVLGDVLYYLHAHHLTGSRTYRFARRMLREANARRAAGRGEVARVDRGAWWFQFWKW